MPLASFPDLAAIDTLRAHPDYRGRAVPDEALFTERQAWPRSCWPTASAAPPPVSGGRTLMVFARTDGTGEQAGRALAGALDAVPGGLGPRAPLEHGPGRRSRALAEECGGVAVRRTAGGLAPFRRPGHPGRAGGGGRPGTPAVRGVLSGGPGEQGALTCGSCGR
ncbi:hypothetical protein ACR6C2_01965 [Streptomyces sp. INA 01156]